MRPAHRRFVEISRFKRIPGGSHDWRFPDGDPYRFLAQRFELSDADVEWEWELPDSAWLDKESVSLFSDDELFALLEAWHLSPALFRPLHLVDGIPP
ncbi:hypothetical protein L6R52_25940 [Myxococcota bacterium]|nr:hypothetical protein [Myxococcota bacterium]